MDGSSKNSPRGYSKFVMIRTQKDLLHVLYFYISARNLKVRQIKSQHSDLLYLFQCALRGQFWHTSWISSLSRHMTASCPGLSGSACAHSSTQHSRGRSVNVLVGESTWTCAASWKSAKTNSYHHKLLQVFPTDYKSAKAGLNYQHLEMLVNNTQRKQISYSIVLHHHKNYLK